MAFNPFHHFRRYSKVVFAGLAILCMITFVLSSGMGRGDMLSQLTDWASGGRRGSEVLTLYGKKFDGGQIRQIQVGRQMASEYMLASIDRARQNVLQRASEGVAKMPEGTARSLAQRAVQTRMFMQFSPQFVDQYRNLMRDTRFRSQLLQAIESADAQKKLEDKATLESVFKMLALDSEVMDRPQNEGYFGGQFTGNISYEETADYLIWLHQAEKLGVQLNHEAVDATITRDTFGELTGNDAREIDRFLRERFGRDGFYSVETLYQVLGDELRVRTAKASLTGESAKVRSAIPGGILTPEESWELFKDARMTVLTGLIDVPVKPFLSQVTATPTDDELKKLYEKYRTQEPAPFSESPGFKEPRKIQVEWLTAEPTLPYYQQAASKVAPLTTALAQIGCAAGGLSGASATGVAEIAHTAAPFVFPDMLLGAQLEEYRRRELRRPWTDNFFPQLHDSSVLRPENVAVLIGATAGAWGSGAPLLSAPLAFEGQAISREVIDRGEIGTAFIGLAAVDSVSAALGQPLPLSILGIPFARVPKPLSVDILRPQLREKAHESLAKSLLHEDLRAFNVEVAKLGKEKDKTAANKYIEEFVKTRGLSKGGTTEPRDLWGLRDDPGLTPLKEAYAKVAGLNDPLLQAFGMHLFQDQMMTFMGQPAKDIEPYSPHEFLGRPDGDRTIVFWKTEDREARVLPFDKAKPRVEAAWKELEARKLAQKEADRLAVKAKADQGDRQKLLDLAAQSNREYFEVGPLARFMPNPTPNPMAGQFRQYQMLDRELFRYPPDKITYPTLELQKKMLDLRKDPKGATVVGNDQPKNHFFVISLLQRDEPTPEEFRNSYVHSMVTATEFDPLLAILANDRRGAYRNEVIKELRAEAKLVINRDARERPPSRDEDVAEQ